MTNVADPFAEAENVTEEPEELQAPDVPESAPNVSVSDSDANKVRVTFKGGTGFSAPWITVDGVNIADARAQLSNLHEVKALMDEVAKMGSYFAKSEQPAQSGAPASAQQTQQAPNGEKRFCTHGEMIYRHGFSKKTGKPYQLFGCPVQDRNQQCQAIFLN